MDYEIKYSGEEGFKNFIKDVKKDREEPWIDPEHYSLDIGLKKPVKLSWISCNDLTDCIGWFDRELENHFPEEFSYYLARTCIGNPVSDKEINETKLWKEAMRAKILEKQKRTELMAKARRNRIKATKNAIQKIEGPYIVEFK